MSALENLTKANDGKAQLAAVLEIKAQLDSTSDLQVSDKLQQDCLPQLLALLNETPLVVTSGAIEQQVRVATLETLQRFSFNESFKPLVNDLMRTTLDLLKNDNEEIACICLKLFIDLHKSYKTSIEEFVQPFLDIVLKIYQNMPETVKEAFSISQSTPATTRVTRTALTQSPQVPSSPSNAGELVENVPSQNKMLNKSMHSFKVLTECPIIIVLLFSTYRQSVQTNLALFTPAIIEMLSLQAPSSKEFLGKGITAASLARKQVLADFMLAQIKTLSFLAYVLRGFTAFMKKYAQAIPQFVTRLLLECPAEMSAARKVCLHVKLQCFS